MQTGYFAGHEFVVSGSLIRGFSGLAITASVETGDKTGDGEKYVTRKNAGVTKVTFTVTLSALTGCDVRTEAMAFAGDAGDGITDYFYVGDSKLLPCALMLTGADIQNVAISPAGRWVSCDVKLTLQKASKDDGTFVKDPAKQEKEETEETETEKRKNEMRSGKKAWLAARADPYTPVVAPETTAQKVVAVK